MEKTHRISIFRKATIGLVSPQVKVALCFLWVYKIFNETRAVQRSSCGRSQQSSAQSNLGAYGQKRRRFSSGETHPSQDEDSTRPFQTKSSSTCATVANGAQFFIEKMQDL